jgi:DNA-directed RNA polymerase
VSNITDTIIEDIQSNEDWAEKYKRQVDLEKKMRTMGIDRYWSQVSKAREAQRESGLRPVRRLLNYSIEEMMGGITRFIEAADSGKPGRRHTALPYLKMIEPEVMALVAARTVLDGIAKEEKITPLARRIASMIEDEISFRRFKKEHPKDYRLLVKRQEKLSNHYYRNSRVLLHNMDTRNVEREDWPARDQVIVGMKLIEIMVETTGLVNVRTRTREKKREERVVEATPETMEWLNEEHNRSAMLSPTYLPTIIPPKPWTSPFTGGYWTDRVRRLALVKTYSKEYLAELSEHEMPDVYDAVNAMQHTAWRVNTDVLEVMRTLWGAKSTLGEIPAADDYDLPTKPTWLVELEAERGDKVSKDEWTDEQMSDFRHWKRAATDVYTHNARLKSMRLQFSKILTIAEMFEDESELFFPHQMDFRGRTYAVPMFLNPQGADNARGLLEFANGVPIDDEDGYAWLAIHGANTYGEDKVSFAQRVEWVEQHQDVILACADDPYSNKLWADADKPWQFLAFCFDWAGLVREGWGYVSHLPVQMDGSCNGLQNFSAILRDPVGAAATNLIHQERPADIYQEVADRVEQIVLDDAHSDDEETAHMAQGWLKHGITRKVAKRPVMTLAYGAKKFGFKQQVHEDTVMPAKMQMGQSFPWDTTPWKPSDYMGTIIWDVVGDVVVAAREAMDWLQYAAREAAKEELPVRWDTPDGMVIQQSYPKLATKRIDMTFKGNRHLITVATGATSKLDRQRQANGIAPNWVHSMDASHLRSTVRQGWTLGLRSFSLVHDSYGTHAANAEVLAHSLRDEFYKQYSEQDVLEDFKEELERQLPVGAELDDTPSKGDLVLKQVLESPYFFA